MEIPKKGRGKVKKVDTGKEDGASKAKEDGGIYRCGRRKGRGRSERSET